MTRPPPRCVRVRAGGRARLRAGSCNCVGVQVYRVMKARQGHHTKCEEYKDWLLCRGTGLATHAGMTGSHQGSAHMCASLRIGNPPGAQEKRLEHDRTITGEHAHARASSGNCAGTSTLMSMRGATMSAGQNGHAHRLMRFVRTKAPGQASYANTHAQKAHELEVVSVPDPLILSSK
eukprot:1160897-Pelagomonas_calceolata.AAC.2